MSEQKISKKVNYKKQKKRPSPHFSVHCENVETLQKFKTLIATKPADITKNQLYNNMINFYHDNIEALKFFRFENKVIEDSLINVLVNTIDNIFLNLFIPFLKDINFQIQKMTNLLKVAFQSELKNSYEDLVNLNNELFEEIERDFKNSIDNFFTNKDLLMQEILRLKNKKKGNS